MAAVRRAGVEEEKGRGPIDVVGPRVVGRPGVARGVEGAAAAGRCLGVTRSAQSALGGAASRESMLKQAAGRPDARRLGEVGDVVTTRARVRCALRPLAREPRLTRRCTRSSCDRPSLVHALGRHWGRSHFLGLSAVRRCKWSDGWSPALARPPPRKLPSVESASVPIYLLSPFPPSRSLPSSPAQATAAQTCSSLLSSRWQRPRSSLPKRHRVSSPFLLLLHLGLLATSRRSVSTLRRSAQLQPVTPAPWLAIVPARCAPRSKLRRAPSRARSRRSRSGALPRERGQQR